MTLKVNGTREMCPVHVVAGISYVGDVSGVCGARIG